MWNATNVPSVDVQASCASFNSCDACLNASYFCHFCAFDFQCHAIGSPLGCAVGIQTCHHLEDCERKEPQPVGYGPPPSVVLVVLCLMVTLACCVCGLVSICSVFLRSSRRRREERQRRQPSQRSKADAAGSDDPLTASPNEPLLSSIREDERILAFEEDVDLNAMARLRQARESQQESGFSWKRLCFRIFWLGVFVVITVLALMFYPRMPDYNVCNRQFEWESIFQSIRHLSPKIEYNVLISVINENRFGFVVESGHADIYHNTEWVGEWVVNQTWEAKAGSISDVIAPIRLTPGYKEGIALWNDFYKNQLIFRINATITGSITWGSYKIYRITSNVPDIEFLVGAEYDRGLCMCPNYET
ncbi:hypothetical protein PINS_up002717 [Pythium insidiosum]|nr:hypothetical protein PINS_up002717 [Pythium insidiosum]